MKEMTTKEVQKVSLDILQDFHAFCVKKGLHYSLSGGTLLGAIRHNGFIPWDDDIDVQMPRPDYDQLLQSYTSEKGYELFSREKPDGEKRNITYSHARICEMRKTIVDTGVLPWTSESVGLWIDILPCDGISNDMEEAKRHLMQVKTLIIRAYWMGIRKSPIENFWKGRNIKAKLKFLAKKFVALFFMRNPFIELYSLRRKYDYTESDYFFVTPHYGLGEWQPKKNMQSFELHRFEDKEFYIMSGWDANLKSLYGDYMTLPPENQRVTHDFNRYYWKD